MTGLMIGLCARADDHSDNCLIAGGRRLRLHGSSKEGEPDIEIPALFISVPFPGISAEDSESLL